MSNVNILSTAHFHWKQIVFDRREKSSEWSSRFSLFQAHTCMKVFVGKKVQYNEIAITAPRRVLQMRCCRYYLPDRKLFYLPIHFYSCVRSNTAFFYLHPRKLVVVLFLTNSRYTASKRLLRSFHRSRRSACPVKSILHLKNSSHERFITV